MLEQIKELIKQAEQSAKECLKSDLVHDTIFTSIENLFYGNLLTNFESNFTIENFDEFKVSKEEGKKVIKNFQGTFNKAKKALEKMGGITEQDYISFKENLKKISSGGSKILLEVEKAMEYSACKKEINLFKEKIKTIGKNVKIEKKIDKGKIGISLKYE